jgi:diguanylate cyclase (GGDEF)-like protein/PAS domain S-box-containing protein
VKKNNLQQRIFSEQVSLLFKQYPLAAFSGFLVTAVVAFTLWQEVPSQALLGWLIAQDLSLVAGSILVLRYRNDLKSAQKATIWFRRYMVAITMIGLLWGGLVFFIQFGLSPAFQNFIIIIVVGLASAALVLALPVLTAYYSYLSLAFLPLVLWFFSRQETVFSVLGLLSVIYYFLLMVAGRNLNRQFINTIRYRFENADLANVVSKLNENLEQRVIEKTHALSESEERFDLAMRGANDGLWDWDLKKQTVYFSPRWKTMLGYDENEIGDSPKEWRQRIHRDDLRKVLSQIRNHIQGKIQAYESIHRVEHKDGHYLWVLDRGRVVRDNDGKAYRMVGTQVDITDHKKLEEKIRSANIKLKHEVKERVLAQKELAHLAKHDPLTNLPNRILFDEQLQEAIRRAEIEDEAIAVLLVDLDNFKNVNDTLGHPIGDRLLVDVANRLDSIVNKNYFLSRFGGDEFIVILEGCADTFLVDAYAREIIELISQPFHLDDQEIRIGCSIGITLFPDHGNDPDQLVRDADIAMYHAKDQGRNTFSYFTEEMDLIITEKVTLRNLLHGAIKRQEFDIHYQPQVNIRTGKVTGLEALLRWHPQGFGVVSPEKFIPLLEETGLINEVGQWVLREACMAAVYLQTNGLTGLKMAVNLSPHQFLQEDLAESVENILTETGLDAKYLEMEITENIFMEDLELIQQTLLRLKEMGVAITLDDFGTGYSSLAYLKRFPINGVKIDKEFVRDVLTSDDTRELVIAIIAMAKGLNMDTLVAEGVEIEAQLDLLRQAGCSTYQGYLYSQPLPRVALERALLPRNRLRSV